MNIYFGRNPIIRLQVLFDNLYEKYTHWRWNRKSNSATCNICGRIISSDDEENSPSPEERGWRKYNKYFWICHQCDAHRDFKPFIKVIDLTDDIVGSLILGREHGRFGAIEEEIKERNLLLDSLKIIDYDEIRKIREYNNSFKYEE